MVGACSLLLLPGLGAAQNGVEPVSTTRERAGFAAVPFRVGESFDFGLQAEWFLIGGNGTASLRVEARTWLTALAGAGLALGRHPHASSGHRSAGRSGCGAARTSRSHTRCF
jgi:hypothetical protein